MKRESKMETSRRSDRKGERGAALVTMLLVTILLLGAGGAMPDTANAFVEDTDVTDADEDVKFLMYVDADLGQRYIVRYEKNGSNQTTVLANRIDSLVFRYYDEKVTYDTTVVDGVCDITNVRNAAGSTESEVSPSAAKFIVIAVGVTLPAVGTANTEGYQPPSQMQLTSDVVLRNSIVY